MPTPRRPLAEISGNTPSRRELTPYQRGLIVGASTAGDTLTQIARRFDHPTSTVVSTLAREKSRINGNSQPRIGRPSTWTERDERQLVRYVRKFPKFTYNLIRIETNLTFSNSTIRRILEPYEITRWRARRRPELSEIHARLRLKWCLEHSDWTIEQWREFIWSDECSIERGRGKLQEWCFGTHMDKWKRTHIQTYTTGKGLSIMVWAAFWGSGRSDLYVLDRDFSSKKHGYSAQSYIAVLDDQLPKCWVPGRTFMQDNAPIHTAKAVSDWFTEQGILVTDWPPYSPDLNPIEHVWWALKVKVLQLHPELVHCGKSESDRKRLEQAIIEAWDALPQELFDRLISSMPNRVAAVIKAKGWHTKY